MRRKGKALYRIELHGKVMPFGRFYSWSAAMDFLETKFGKESEMLAVFEIIDDNDIPF